MQATKHEVAIVSHDAIHTTQSSMSPAGISINVRPVVSSGILNGRGRSGLIIRSRITEANWHQE